ncbi:MAG: DUF1292 domain-containing protein [Lachnospiraceae bacterium]|jgi:hypothetical protein|nr:DUF1292 domain-containing protein [Lachnospiraceae bacterium]MCR5702420.1 DUF1292 domain-containing protein [Lachnospiraceae bacterium]
MSTEKDNITYTEDTITIVLENDKEVECDILAIFPVREQFYIAIMPQTPIEGFEEDEYFLYRYASDGENVELSDIESEEELEAAEDKFEELLDEEEFNSMEDK